MGGKGTGVGGASWESIRQCRLIETKHLRKYGPSPGIFRSRS
nr:MAG TPA: hypothetical protein [Caudoviricetes sp.]